VDGYSPVYAIMTKASAATADSSSSSRPQHNVSQESEEKVQVSLSCTTVAHSFGKGGMFAAHLYLAHHLRHAKKPLYVPQLAGFNFAGHWSVTRQPSIEN